MTTPVWVGLGIAAWLSALCVLLCFLEGARLGDEQLADPTPADADAELDEPIDLEPVYDQVLDTDDFHAWSRELQGGAR